MAENLGQECGDNRRKRKLPDWMVGLGTKTSAQQAACSTVVGETRQLNLPYLKFPGTIVYSYQEDDCSLLCDDILEGLVVDQKVTFGFDLEWPVTYKSGETSKTALLQLCTSHNRCYLFHLSRMMIFPPGLKTLLCDHRVVKTGVGIESDLWRLDKDYDVAALSIICHSMVDLSPWANRVLNCKQTWSLDGLCQNMLQKQLDKTPGIRMGDWTAFPLSQAQQNYAATDAYASLLLYEECQKRQEKLDQKRQEKHKRNMEKQENQEANNSEEKEDSVQKNQEKEKTQK